VPESEVPIKVLVVDDTTHVREMLSAILSVSGFDVVGESADGLDAVDAAETWSPDVVVVDYRMPGVDGLETARRIRARRPDQTIILHSAFVDDDLATAAASAGVALCLAKGDGIGALEQEITRLARPRR
jgi:DNA-binding NarL/FixJ family response regulator